MSEAAEKLQGVHDWFHDRVRFHIKPYCFFEWFINFNRDNREGGRI